MASERNWAVTDFSQRDAVVLAIFPDATTAGTPTKFAVSQFTASFTINQIPEALCALAIGRNVSTLQAAAIHNLAEDMTPMRAARVTAKLRGDFTTDNNQPWPDKEVVLFEGYYVGSGYQKINGKVQYVVHLLHWLADMGFSSSINGVCAPSSQLSLAFPAVFAALQGSVNTDTTTGTETEDAPGGGSGQFSFLPENAIQQSIGLSLAVSNDFWAAMKQMLIALGTFRSLPFDQLEQYGQELGALNLNNRGLRALARIEGPALAGTDLGVPNLAYRYAKAMPLAAAVAGTSAIGGIAGALSHIPVASLVAQTLWDVLIAELSPRFNLDICPTIDRAIVIPSIPAWRSGAAGYWRTLPPEEYSFVDQNTMIPKPLRAVVCMGDVYVHSGLGGNNIDVAGIFVGKSRRTGAATQTPTEDGAILFTPMPSWLGYVAYNSESTDASLRGEAPPTSDPTLSATIEQIARAYAQNIYIQNSLRGRSGTVIGKLRFDIAPGSHIKLIGSAERFIGAEDALAANQYAQVNRVTIEINSESRRAATSFLLTHLRNERENQEDRTSIIDPPLFPGVGSGMVKGGLPLLPELEMPAKT